MEIERKWLFSSPNAPEGVKLLRHEKYGQAYLSIEPEVRIRWRLILDEDPTYRLCIKGKGTIIRHEVEKDLLRKEFEQLMEVGHLEFNDFIIKNTNFYDINGRILALGVTDIGRESAFMYGEIEFPTIEEANAFVAPDWFGKEVTNDPSYKMANYWARTRFPSKIQKES